MDWIVEINRKTTKTNREAEAQPQPPAELKLWSTRSTPNTSEEMISKTNASFVQFSLSREDLTTAWMTARCMSHLQSVRSLSLCVTYSENYLDFCRTFVFISISLRPLVVLGPWWSRSYFPWQEATLALHKTIMEILPWLQYSRCVLYILSAIRISGR